MAVLVIDIQSDIVEGSIVEFPATGEKPQTLYSTRVQIFRKAHTNGEYFTKMMLQAVEDLSLHIVKETQPILLKPIEAAHYILSSPWILSQSKTVQVEYKKDTQITEAIVRNIVDADRKALISKYEPDMVFVEQKIFGVELNGYSVEKYAGQKARTLKVSFAFTLSSDELIQKIQAAVAKHLHVRHEFYHSAILLQYISSRASSSDREEYIVLHVHGEITDVVIVKKGFSSYLASFPFGTMTLVRKMAGVLRSSMETAISTLSMHIGEKSDEVHYKKVEHALVPVIKSWQADCAHAFRGMGEGSTIPRAVHMYIESPLLPLFKKALEEMQFEVHTHEGSLREIHSFALKDVI